MNLRPFPFPRWARPAAPAPAPVPIAPLTLRVTPQAQYLFRAAALDERRACAEQRPLTPLEELGMWLLQQVTSHQMTAWLEEDAAAPDVSPWKSR
jgi:hypothetical protein